MPLSPAVAIHLTSALTAFACGPVALWARRSHGARPTLHRAFGYAFVASMVCAAVSALFIHTRSFPNVGGFSWIHLLVPLTLGSLIGAFRALARRNYVRHRQIMQNLYLGACLGAGAFALLPSRYLGHLVWGEWLGLLAS
jgi:uncharacterized membrane protein